MSGKHTSKLDTLKKLFDKKSKYLDAFDAYVLFLHDDLGYTTYRIARTIGRSDMYIVRALLRAKKNGKNK